ncbi:hypothetical protein M422DRAFT_265458 [Sphaerobolus stellatus SS14]|uniref:Uncharacterized protein n=1 Tax=Sphaerobolus stellatus (strain SS14) TaxID=990650 RepID=A0A0C9V5C3_SPHS4|nr:hypothetical protein M422DRAFT_265458 [Sphaerobolus stellatus SS14]
MDRPTGFQFNGREGISAAQPSRHPLLDNIYAWRRLPFNKAADSGSPRLTTGPLLPSRSSIDPQLLQLKPLDPRSLGHPRFPRPSAGIKRQYDSEQERPLVVDPALFVEKRKYDLNEEITTNEDEKYDLPHQKQTLNGRPQYSGTATKNASKLLTPFISKAYSGNSFILPSPTPVDKNETSGC